MDYSDDIVKTQSVTIGQDRYSESNLFKQLNKQLKEK